MIQGNVWYVCRKLYPCFNLNAFPKLLQMFSVKQFPPLCPGVVVSAVAGCEIHCKQRLVKLFAIKSTPKSGVFACRRRLITVQKTVFQGVKGNLLR